MTETNKLKIAMTALASIATGRISGEPHNHRDTVSIMRAIAKEALVSIDARCTDWFAIDAALQGKPE